MSKKQNRRGGTAFNEQRRSAFLMQLRLNGNATEAAGIVGIDRTTAYDWRNKDADFAKAWDAAISEGYGRLADMCIAEAFRRGHGGWDEPVVSQGQVVKDPVNGGFLKIRKYSDSLLAKLMDGMAARVFKPASLAHNSDSLPAELQPDPPTTPDEARPEKPVE